MAVALMVLVTDEYADEGILHFLNVEPRHRGGFVGNPMRQVQDLRTRPQAVNQRRHLGTLSPEVEAMLRGHALDAWRRASAWGAKPAPAPEPEMAKLPAG